MQLFTRGLDTRADAHSDTLADKWEAWKHGEKSGESFHKQLLNKCT